MRLIHTSLLAATFVLAACGGSADTDGDGAISGEEAVAEAAGAIRPEPGQYRTRTEVLEFNVPGVPDAVKREMQGSAAAARTFTYCLTPEQAAANGSEQMTKNMVQGNCTFARFDVAGGTISAEMQCAGANGASTHVTMDGQMTSTSSTMTMTNETDMQDMGKMQMKMRMTSERIGDCPA